MNTCHLVLFPDLALHFQYTWRHICGKWATSSRLLAWCLQYWSETSSGLRDPELIHANFSDAIPSYALCLFKSTQPADTFLHFHSFYRANLKMKSWSFCGSLFWLHIDSLASGPGPRVDRQEVFHLVNPRRLLSKPGALNSLQHVFFFPESFRVWMFLPR